LFGVTCEPALVFGNDLIAFDVQNSLLKRLDLGLQLEIAMNVIANKTKQMEGGIKS